MNWADVRYFLSVARTGSLTRAAAGFRVSPSTVSRRIEALESDLGVRLFARHATGYTLTDHGRDMLARAKALEDAALDLERVATGLDSSSAGTVRLATAETLATHLLIPALPAFLAQHRGLRLEILTGTATVALARSEADLALRVTRPAAGHLTVRRVGAMEHAVYGSENYLRRRRAPAATPLEGRAVVRWDSSHAHLPAARWLAERFPDAPTAMTVSSMAAHLAAARAGLGLAVLPRFLGSSDGELREVPLAGPSLVEDLWLVAHADLARSERVRRVGEFVAATVASAAGRLRAPGRVPRS